MKAASSAAPLKNCFDLAEERQGNSPLPNSQNPGGEKAPALYSPIVLSWYLASLGVFGVGEAAARGIPAV